MADDIVDEAAVQINAEIAPDFEAKVKKAIESALKGVNAQVKKALAPVKKSIEDSIVKPMEQAATRVGVSSKRAGVNIARGVKSGTDKAARSIDELVAKIQAELGSLDPSLEIDVTADTTAAQAEIDRVSNGISDLDINVDVDIAWAQAEIDAFIAYNSTRTIDIGVNVDTAGATAALGALNAATARAGATADDSKSRFFGLFDGIDRGAGGSGQSFDRAQFNILKYGAAGVGLIATFAPIGPLFSGLAAGVVAVAGAMTIAAGAMISTGVAASSLALAFATVKIGSAGVGDALKAQSAAQKELAATGEVSAATQEKLDAALKNLAPSARELVGAIRAISPAWSKVRKATQQALFESTGPALEKLSGVYLPIVREALAGTAEDFNKFGLAAVKNLTSPGTSNTINETLEGLRKILQSLIPALGNFAAGFGTFFAGAIGEANTLSETFLKTGERFREFAKVSVESGEFADFLERARHAATALFDVIGGLGSVIGTIFSAGAEKGTGLLASFGQTLESLNDSLESVSGQKALEGFFNTTAVAGAALRDIISVLGPIMNGLGDIFEELSPALDKVRTAMLPIAQEVGQRLGDTFSFIAPAIGAVVEGISYLLDAIKPIAPAIGVWVSALVLLKIALITNPIVLVVAALGALAFGLKKAYDNSEAFRNIVNSIGDGIKSILVPAFEAVKPALDGLVAALPGVAEKFGGLVTGILEKIAPLAEDFAAFGAKIGDAISSFGSGDLGSKITDSLKQVLPAIGQIVGQIGPLFKSIIPVLQTIGAFVVGTVVPAFKDLAVILAENIGPAATIVSDIFTNSVVPAAQQVIGFVDGLLQTLGSLAATIMDAVVPIIRELINQFVVNLLPALQTVYQQFNDNVLPVLLKLGTVIYTVVAAITKVAVWVLGKLIPPFLRFAGPIIGFVIKAVAVVIGWLFKFIGKILEVGGAVVKFAGVAKEKFDTIKAKVIDVVSNIKSRFEEFKSKMSDLGAKVASVVSALKSKFDDIKAKIINVVAGAKEKFEAFKQGFQGVQDKVSEIVGKIKGFFTDLVDAASGLGSSIGDNIKSGITSIINGAISGINSMIKTVNKIPKVNVPTLDYLANGAIVDRATMAVVGEAGREVVIPLTRPARAAELAVESGLLNLAPVQAALVSALSTSQASRTLTPGRVTPAMTSRTSVGALSNSRSTASEGGTGTTITIGQIMPHNYGEFERQMLSKARLASIGGRRP